MCGISGFIDWRCATGAPELSRVATVMASHLAHRGPDGQGVWVDETAGVALGHRRLSIIDVSPTGSQPMVSHSGRYVLAYNGEIYNYRSLRNDLLRGGVHFRGSSDTEVVAAALDVWGIDSSLERMDGMFAIAAWDRRQHELLLARDRFGEKPLYFGEAFGRVYFASELRAITGATGPLEIDDRAAADVITHKAVQGDRTIYRGFRKVRPGHLVVVAEGGCRSRCYWSPSQVALEALDHPLDIDERGAAEELAQRLLSTVGTRTVADVPVGAFLSGGVDSTALVAAMAATSSEPVQTFTVGLEDIRYDESRSAEVVADRLGTRHHTLRVTPNDVVSLVPRIAQVYDEPFADSSQIPTLLVSTFASSHVKVALTGDGGDEVFGGYNRHVHGDRLMKVRAYIPRPVRSNMASWLQRLDPMRAEKSFDRLAPWLPAAFRIRLPAEKGRKLGRVLGATDRQAAYHALVTEPDGGRLLSRATAAPGADDGLVPGIAFSQAAMLADTQTYLPNDILVKLDRAAMSVSLETRAPFLSPDLFRWSWSLPPDLRISRGVGKRVLRSAMDAIAPGLGVPTVKSGFGIPVGDWLRGPLRPWAQDLLAPIARGDGEVLQPGAIRGLWEAHQAGTADHTHELWSVLMLASWMSHRTSVSGVRSAP